MKQQPVLKQWGTITLTVVFLAATLVRTGHLLFWHHLHHQTPVCEAAHDESARHIHDARYNPDDCQICAYLFGIPELTAIPGMPLLPVATYQERPVYQPLWCSASDIDHSHLRGPPVQLFLQINSV